MKKVPRSRQGSASASEPLFYLAEKDDQSSHLQRQVIGYLGLLLSPALYCLNRWRLTDGQPLGGPLDSVSAYYYSGAVAVFVGVLAALAVFLLTYRGYQNERRRWDRIAGMVAGLAALGVAFFPTKAPSYFTAPTWWSPYMYMAHNLSAAALFSSFAFFSLFLFPKKDPKMGVVPADKQRRNVVYIACGVVMVICMARIVFKAQGEPIFWEEAAALSAFAVSWLTKGRALWTLPRLGIRMGQYLMDPKRFAGDLWDSLGR
jgi:hypothetical protein